MSARGGGEGNVTRLGTEEPVVRPGPPLRIGDEVAVCRRHRQQ